MHPRIVLNTIKLGTKLNGNLSKADQVGGLLYLEITTQEAFLARSCTHGRKQGAAIPCELLPAYKNYVVLTEWQVDENGFIGSGHSDGEFNLICVGWISSIDYNLLSWLQGHLRQQEMRKHMLAIWSLSVERHSTSNELRKFCTWWD